ncbi:hypothetical protein BDZ45DRAFT_703477 [Acephala macrosclerotiorum]|nr:hypothetical protein BDZ45DRAFT_703477 [Acephala macrosclerotiorum]
MATIYYEPTGCNCDNKTSYDKAQINLACTQALNLAKEKETLGRDKYPHAYNDYEKVVIGSIATDYSSAIFCAVLTHDGSTKNGFTECKDDTVNQNGKGTYEKKGSGKGREPGQGRKLLERIDL